MYAYERLSAWPAVQLHCLTLLRRRCTAYMSSPCHIELTLSEKSAGNVKAEPEEQSQKRLTKVLASGRAHDASC